MKPNLHLTAAPSALAKRLLFGLVAACGLAWLAMPVGAVERRWTGEVSGLWSIPGNWDPVGPPQNGDVLLFRKDDAHRSMTNDTLGLRIASLSFGGEGNDSNYTLDGNSLMLTGTGSGMLCLVEPDGSATVTINCPLVFTNGGSIVEGNYHVGWVSQGETVLRLNGPITLNGGEVEFVLEESDVSAGYRSIVHVAGPVSGQGDIRSRVHYPQGAGSYFEFTGTAANTFQGALIVGLRDSDHEFGKVVLNKQTGVPAVPDTARLVIEHGSVAQLNSSEQIGDNATVEVRSGGQFRLVDFFETIGRLVLLDFMDNGDIRPPMVDAGTRQLALNGNLICDRSSTNSQAIPRISGTLNLNGFIPIEIYGTRDPRLEIAATIVGNGFDKQGRGTLRLSGTNSFIGDVAVTEGTIEPLTPSAFGQAGPTSGVHLNGGDVLLQSIAIGAEPLFVNSSASLLTAIGACSWAGPITLNAELQVVALDPSFSSVPFNISGTISGNSGLNLLAALFGVGNVRLSGSAANTFTGPLTVGCQRLELNKPSGVNAFGGPLIVGRPGAAAIDEVRWLNSYQHVGATVTLYSNALVNLNNFNEDFGPITFNGGQIETGIGQCAIYQPLTVNPSSATALIEGNLGLPPGGPARFNIGNGAAEFDLLVNATVFGSSPDLIKEGGGTMALTAANTYTGETHANEGVLFISDGRALGSASARTFVRSNATLRLGGAGTITDSLNINGAGVDGSGAISIINGGSWTLNGVLSLDGPSTIDAGSNASLTINSGILGTGALTKAGAGSLILAGTVNNSYSGDTIVGRGTLILNKPGGTTTVPHHLIIGTGAFNSPATVQHNSGFTIVGSVTVDRGGLWDLNGQAEGFTVTSLEGRPALTLNNGGRVQTGAGIIVLPTGGDVVVNPGSIGSSTISGRIGLDPGTHHFIIGHKTNPLGGPECTISAAIGETSNPAELVKDGSGTLLLSATNTHRGATTVNAGTLRVDGVQPQSFAVLNAGTRLQGTGTIGHLFISGSAAVAPGNGAGTLTCSNFNAGIGGSGVLQTELSGTTPGSGYDQVNVRGAVNLSGVTLNASHNFASAVGNSFTIINNDGIDSVIGTFAGLPEGARFHVGGERFTISYTGGTGNDVVLTRLVTPPAPLLSIERVPPASVRLLWPTNAADFGLQFNTNVIATNTWAAALPLPVILGTNNVVTNIADGIQRFYRLAAP